MFPDGLKLKPKPVEKGAAPFHMNNFYMNLPCGGYREFVGAEGAEERERVMAAVDQLLATEFNSLDVSRIFAVIREGVEALGAAVVSGKCKTREDFEAVCGPQVTAKDLAVEELRPLFDRLVELGFSPESLAR